MKILPSNQRTRRPQSLFQSLLLLKQRLLALHQRLPLLKQRLLALHQRLLALHQRLLPLHQRLLPPHQSPFQPSPKKILKISYSRMEHFSSSSRETTLPFANPNRRASIMSSTSSSNRFSLIRTNDALSGCKMTKYMSAIFNP